MLCGLTYSVNAGFVHNLFTHSNTLDDAHSPIDKSIISGYTTPSQRDDGNQ